MTRRVIEIDRVTMKNIIYIEKMLVNRLRACMRNCRECKNHIDILKAEEIDIAETEENMLATYDPGEQYHQAVKKTAELNQERDGLASNLKMFLDQRHAIEDRNSCLLLWGAKKLGEF